MLTFKKLAAQIDFCELEIDHALVIWKGHEHPHPTARRLAALCCQKLGMLCELEHEIAMLNHRTTYLADEDLFALYEETRRQFFAQLGILADLLRHLLPPPAPKRLAEVLQQRFGTLSKIPAPK